MFSVAIPPVVECSSRDLGCGAYLVDHHPLPSSSHAPASQSCNVSRLLHVCALCCLSTYECAVCYGITDASSNHKSTYIRITALVYLYRPYGICYLSRNGDVENMITKKGIMSMLKIHLGLGTKHMNQQISTASEACSCKRCTCPHPAGQYHSVRMNSLGKDQVFCSECNDICMTDSRIV
jgi:hypothetical protein